MKFTQADFDQHLIDSNGKLTASLPTFNEQTGEVETIVRPVKTKQEGYLLIAQALAKEEVRKAEMHNERPKTFRELVNSYLAYKSLPRWYVEVALEFFSDYALEEITYAALAAFKAYRQAVPHSHKSGQRKTATINRELEIVRRLLTFAVRCQWIQQSPFLRGEPLLCKNEENARHRLLTDEEEERLLAGCVGPRAHLRPIIIAAMDTGLRRGALLSLKVGQLDLERRIISLGRPKTKHKNHPPCVGISQRLADELAQLLAECPELKPEEPVFGIKGIKRSWTTLCREAGIADLRFHDLRHRFATDAVRAGVPQALAMRATGHSNPEIFDRYVNPDAEVMLGITQQIDRHRRERRQGKAATSEQ